MDGLAGRRLLVDEAARVPNLTGFLGFERRKRAVLELPLPGTRMRQVAWYICAYSRAWACILDVLVMIVDRDCVQ